MLIYKGTVLGFKKVFFKSTLEKKSNLGLDQRSLRHQGNVLIIDYSLSDHEKKS